MTDALIRTRKIDLNLWRPSDQSRFDRHSKPASSGCILWTGYIKANGYGQFKWRNQQWYAHRIAHALAYDLDLDGMTVDHLCRTRRCVNPGHLDAVTSRVNVLRGETIYADQSVRTYCPRGHELAGDNLMPSRLRRGQRECLACSRINSAITRAAVRDACTMLGITKAAYIGLFSASGVVARAVIHALILGATVAEVTSQSDLYRSCTPGPGNFGVREYLTLGVAP